MILPTTSNESQAPFRFLQDSLHVGITVRSYMRVGANSVVAKQSFHEFRDRDSFVYRQSKASERDCAKPLPQQLFGYDDLVTMSVLYESLSTSIVRDAKVRAFSAKATLRSLNLGLKIDPHPRSRRELPVGTPVVFGFPLIYRAPFLGFLPRPLQ